VLHPHVNFWTAAPPGWPASSRTSGAARGEMVGLRMDPAGCHLFPVEP